MTAQPNTAVARTGQHVPATATDDPYAGNPMPPARGTGVSAYIQSSPVGAILSSEQARAQIVPLLPKGVDYETVMLEVHRAATVEPKILKCTAASIIMAVAAAVQTGLIIGKTIHLVPLYDTNSKETRLNAWTDYKGDIELVVRSGAARLIDHHAIYSGDIFEYENGTHPFIKHRPTLDPKARGQMIGAYAVGWINGSGSIKKICVLTLADIEKVRVKSKQWNPEKVATCPDWYGEKTAVHRLCKTLPKSPALAKIIAMMDAQEAADQLDDGEEALDPTMRIGAPDPATSGFSTANEAAKPAAGAEDDDLPWESAPVAPAPAKRSGPGAFAMPFGGDKFVGTPIGDLSHADLTAARAWAEKKGGYPLFVEKVDELLEERRFAGEEASV